MMTHYELTGCPVCGSADAFQLADQVEIQNEFADLWAWQTRRMRPTTNPAELTDRLAFSQAPPIRVARCSACTHIYRNPRERGVTGLYGAESVDPEALSALFDAQRPTFDRQIHRLQMHAPGRTNGLEIGSYVGAFLAAARGAGWQFHGVDVNSHAVAFARAQGLEVSVGTIDDVTERRFDVVAFWNCFEQLDDVRAAARSARDRLHNGGIVTIRVPNGDYWAALRRCLRGLGGPIARAALAQNNLLSFPYRNGFTRRSLETLMHATGFDVVAVYGEFSLPAGSRGAPRWVSFEGRAVHALVRTLRRVTGAPWIELYARIRS